MNKRQVKKRVKVQEHSRGTNTNTKMVKDEELKEVAATTIESDVQEENVNIEKSNKATKDTSKESIKVENKVDKVLEPKKEDVKKVATKKVEQAVEKKVVEPKLSLSNNEDKVKEECINKVEEKVEEEVKEVAVEDTVKEDVIVDEPKEEVLEVEDKKVEPVEKLEVEKEVIIENTSEDEMVEEVKETSEVEEVKEEAAEESKEEVTEKEIVEEVEEPIEEYKIPEVIIEEPSVEDILPEEYLSIIKEKAIKLFTVKKAGYTSYEVKALLKNFSYFKTVKVKFTTDNWETYKEADLHYMSDEADKLEMWGNVIDINSYTPENAEFVLYYSVNGAEYWDNNEKNNYRFN